MKRGVWIVLVAVVGIIAAISVYFYVFHKPHRDIDNEKALTPDAGTFYQEFVQDEQSANAKYLDKTIEIKGTITDVTAEYLILDDHVVCAFDPSQAERVIELGQGKEVTVKGRLVSWDSLFEEVRMDQCILVE